MKGYKPFPLPVLLLCLSALLLSACGGSHPQNGPGALNISNSTLPGGVVQSAYSVTLVPTGGLAPYTWSLNSGTLPPGLTLSAGGIISGTPLITDLDSMGNAKTYSFNVKVTDSQTPTAAFQTKGFSIVINPLPVVTSTTLANGTIGLPYSAPLTNTGGLAPFTWVVVSPGTGTLPPGLTLSGTNISGTPTTAGVFPFTIQVTDADGNTASANVSITITGKLQGTFAFSFNGFDNGQPFYTVGTFTGDGGGNITAGFLDQNGVTASDVATDAPFTGTYSVGTNGLGTMTLVIPALGTFVYDLAPALSGDLRFILADPNHPSVYGSGVIKAQAVSSLSYQKLSGSWALGYFGVDAAVNRSAGAGSFKMDPNGNLTSGIEDTNDNGVPAQGQALTGAFVLDSDFTSTGRGTATLTVAGNTLHYAFYVVSALNEMVAVQTDAASVSLSLVSLLKQCAGQTGNCTFSNGTLNAASVMELNGVSTTTGSPLADIQLGVANFDGKGNITLFQTDENNGGTYIAATPLTGTYTLDPSSGGSTGRVLVSGLGTGPQPVWYMVSSNRGFAIGTDSSATEGSFEPQVGSPFSLASFLLSYAGGTVQPALSSITNEVDSTTIPAPGGTLVVTYETSGSGGPQSGLPTLKLAYALGDDPNKTGMNTTGKLLLTAVGTTPSNACACTDIVYMIIAPGSGVMDRTTNKWASINVATAAGASDPNPRLTIVQSTSGPF